MSSISLLERKVEILEKLREEMEDRVEKYERKMEVLERRLENSESRGDRAERRYNELLRKLNYTETFLSCNFDRYGYSLTPEELRLCRSSTRIPVPRFLSNNSNISNTNGHTDSRNFINRAETRPSRLFEPSPERGEQPRGVPLRERAVEGAEEDEEEIDDEEELEERELLGAPALCWIDGNNREHILSDDDNVRVPYGRLRGEPLLLSEEDRRRGTPLPPPGRLRESLLEEEYRRGIVRSRMREVSENEGRWRGVGGGIGGARENHRPPPGSGGGGRLIREPLSEDESSNRRYFPGGRFPDPEMRDIRGARRGLYGWREIGSEAELARRLRFEELSRDRERDPLSDDEVSRAMRGGASTRLGDLVPGNNENSRVVPGRMREQQQHQNQVRGEDENNSRRVVGGARALSPARTPGGRGRMFMEGENLQRRRALRQILRDGAAPEINGDLRRVNSTNSRVLRMDGGEPLVNHVRTTPGNNARTPASEEGNVTPGRRSGSAREQTTSEDEHQPLVDRSNDRSKVSAWLETSGSKNKKGRAAPKITRAIHITDAYTAPPVPTSRKRARETDGDQHPHPKASAVRCKARTVTGKICGTLARKGCAICNTPLCGNHRIVTVKCVNFRATIQDCYTDPNPDEAQDTTSELTTYGHQVEKMEKADKGSTGRCACCTAGRHRKTSRTQCSSCYRFICKAHQVKNIRCEQHKNTSAPIPNEAISDHSKLESSIDLVRLREHPDDDSEIGDNLWTF